MNTKQYINVLIKARVCPSGVTATANTCPHTHINTHWCLCEGTEPFPYARHALTHKHTHTCLCSQTFIHFGPTALECHVKLSEFMKKIRFMDGSSFIFLSVQFFFFFYLRDDLCCRSAWTVTLSAWTCTTHTNTHTHRGLPYGKQSSGRGNEACVNSIVPVAFCLAASEETTGERKKEKGRWRGVLKDDCRGRKGGWVCASVWLNGKNAMCSCDHVWVFFFWMRDAGSHCLLCLLLCPLCSWDEHESRVPAQENLEQSQDGQVRHLGSKFAWKVWNLESLNKCEYSVLLCSTWREKKKIFFHLKSTLWNVFRIVSLF